MATLYDDGSSTESEYYFDPAEETAEAALGALEVKQEPVVAGGRDPEADDQWAPPALNCRNAELPPGSEWSHGAATNRSGATQGPGSDEQQRLAAENALALANRLHDELHGGSRQQQEQELTADTLDSNEQDVAHEPAAPDTEEEAVVSKGSAPAAKVGEKDVPGVPKAEEMKMSKSRPRIVSLKSRPPPASMAVASGLRRPLTKVLGAPRELEEGLSVPRSSEQKAVASLALAKLHTERSGSKKPPGHHAEHKTSPRRHQVTRSRSKSPPTRRPADERRVSRAWTRSPARSNTTEHLRSHLPSRGVERGSSRATASPSRHREQSRSSSSVRDRKSRSSARSPRYESKHSRSRSRSTGRDKPSHRESSRSGVREKELPPHRRERSSIAVDHRNVHHSHDSIDRSGDVSREKDLPSRRHENWRDTTDERKDRHDDAHRSNERDSRRTPRLRELEPLSARRSAALVSSRKRMPDVEADVNARSPVRPHIRSRVGAFPARSGTVTGQEKINRSEASAGKKSALKQAKPSRALLDAFARRVRKLKLQEADVDEQFAVGFLNPSDKWFLEKRTRGMAVEKAQLNAQNCERFEALYKAMAISEAEVQRYRQDRAFAWRVVCFKRKQTFLQDQRTSAISPQSKEQLERDEMELQAERKELMAADPSMFHRVMMSQDASVATFKARDRGTSFQRGGESRRPSKRSRDAGFSEAGVQPRSKRHASYAVNLSKQQKTPAATSSGARVVAGVALKLQRDDTCESTPQVRRFRGNNTSWFLNFDK